MLRLYRWQNIFQTVLLHKFSFRQEYAKSHPHVCAQPSGGKVSVFPPPAFGFLCRQSHNFKVKTEERCDTHTHTHQSTCMQATLISRPSIPRFFHIYFPASFALLWCIIEAVCNFTSSFLAESLLKLNFHFSCSCGIFSLKWRVELFEHAGQHTFPPARLTPSPLRIILTLSQKQKFTQHHLNLSFLVIKVNLFILSFYWKKSQLFTCFFHLTPYFNGLTLFFISKFCPEYPLMTKWKKIAWNSCKLIKN